MATSSPKTTPSPTEIENLLLHKQGVLFIPSPSLMISCGCVPVDPIARKIAILRDTSATNPNTQLPKGRKNIHESSLHATALRETFEETGIPFSALPLRIATRATPTVDMLSEAGQDAKVVGATGISDDFVNCEASSVCAYKCQSTGAFKLVFWFAAQGDSTVTPASDTKDPWESHLQHEWVDASEAASLMTFEADGQVIEKVLADMRNTGYDI